ncbi:MULTISPECIES: 15-cis-phytoene synthase CrtB [Massilia]|uniref:15-cis-phytoene synthase CrtB n=1 Tax=Massilia orientalis TaxID=3050128 RepID=A0ACC7MCL4_9BURK|nr:MULTISPECIES: 15-cis-phytoene synthase CrtB [unclassified Massilia]KQY18643.1 phytoene synthase [Massilia sp. Root133]KQZ53805.1 phytoene synthase [Massilia sp. Root1485]MDN4041673.1 phytoene/squalene synthase family protein [Massilia sp. YIM B02787]
MSEALLDHATETIRVGSKSFAAAAKLFDRDTRRSVLMLYAWCRHCDDVVDGQALGHNTTAPADAAAQVERLRNQTLSAYAGEPQSAPAFAAFQDVALRHAISPHHAFDHLAGFAMDAADARYETIDDTLRYCYHVAGVVGLMMASIMGARDAAVLDRACDLGLAFQLTNIARDIVEDARVGRVYVPAGWLREAGIPTADVAHERHRAALARVAARLVDHAEPYYDSAMDGVAALPLRSAWAIATARRVYREIGIEVKRRGARAWDTRAGTSRATKLRLLALGGVDALASRFRKPGARPTGLWHAARHRATHAVGA